MDMLRRDDFCETHCRDEDKNSPRRSVATVNVCRPMIGTVGLHICRTLTAFQLRFGKCTPIPVLARQIDFIRIGERRFLAELRPSGPGCGVSPLASEADHSRRARKRRGAAQLARGAYFSATSDLCPSPTFSDPVNSLSAWVFGGLQYADSRPSRFVDFATDHRTVTVWELQNAHVGRTASRRRRLCERTRGRPISRTECGMGSDAQPT